MKMFIGQRGHASMELRHAHFHSAHFWISFSSWNAGELWAGRCEDI